MTVEYSRGYPEYKRLLPRLYEIHPAISSTDEFHGSLDSRLEQLLNVEFANDAQGSLMQGLEILILTMDFLFGPFSVSYILHY
jgi:hypothetical protein